MHFWLQLTPYTKPAQERVSTIITFTVATSRNEALLLKVLSCQPFYVTYKIMIISLMSMNY